MCLVTAQLEPRENPQANKQTQQTNPPSQFKIKQSKKTLEKQDLRQTQDQDLLENFFKRKKIHLFKQYVILFPLKNSISN